MILDEIRQHLRNGFRPFVLTLADGERVAVRRPGEMAVGKTTVVMLDKRDRTRVIDQAAIQSLHDLPATQRKEKPHAS